MKNGAVHVVSIIIRNVMPLSAKANITVMYLNVKCGVIIRNTLKEMVYPNISTPLKMGNSTAEGIVIRTIAPKRYKSIEMRFY